MRDNWFTYDWYMEDGPAQFAVDMRFAERPPDRRRPALMYLSCEREDGGPFGALDTWRLGRIEKKCCGIKALYVGRIQDGCRRVMFFYADSPDRAGELEAVAAKEKRLSCRTGCSQDPGWDTYFSLLCPDEAKRQTEANRENIGRLRRGGDCLAAPRRVTFRVYFPLEDLSLQFAREARLQGFAIGGYEYSPELEAPFGVQLHRISPVQKPEIDRLTSDIIYAAQRHSGSLLCWDCPTVSHKAP